MITCKARLSLTNSHIGNYETKKGQSGGEAGKKNHSSGAGSGDRNPEGEDYRKKDGHRHRHRIPRKRITQEGLRKGGRGVAVELEGKKV